MPILRTNEHHGYDSGKSRPPDNYPGRTGSMGEDAPAINQSMVIAEAKELLRGEELKRAITMGVERMDAAALLVIHKAIQKVNEILDSKPERMDNPIHQAEANIKHNEMIVQAASRLFTLANRLPKGNYAPTVVVEGQRYEISLEPRDYCVLQGELHFRRSVVRIMDSTQNKGSCTRTPDGVCYYVKTYAEKLSDPNPRPEDTENEVVLHETRYEQPEGV